MDRRYYWDAVRWWWELGGEEVYIYLILEAIYRFDYSRVGGVPDFGRKSKRLYEVKGLNIEELIPSIGWLERG